MPLLIPTDPADVAHVYFSGGAIQDTKSNAWVKSGFPSFIPAAAFNQVVQVAAGFSDTDHFTLGSGSDVLDFTGNFIATMIVAGNTANAVLFSNGAFQTAGYYFQYSAGTFTIIANTAGSNTSKSTSLSASDATTPHVLSFGRSGSFYVCKGDNLASVTASFGTMIAGTSFPAALGWYSSTGFPWRGAIYEARFTTGTPTPAILDALHVTIGSPSFTGSQVLGAASRWNKGWD